MTVSEGFSRNGLVKVIISPWGGRPMKHRSAQSFMRQILSARRVLTVLVFALPVAPLAAAPAITQILNNSSGTPAGLPNYGIAPSSLFIVTGTGLADPGLP